MRIEFKLFNPEVVDCSTGYVNIVALESSLKVLLDIILRVGESEFVKTVGGFGIRIQGDDGSLFKFEAPHVCGEFGYNSKYLDAQGISKDNMIKQNSEENKIQGLYVETIDSVKSRLTKNSNNISVQAGLLGIKEAIQIINTILEKKIHPKTLQKIEKIVFLSLNVDIGFVKGDNSVRILLDSRRSVISIIFDSDGLPTPDEVLDEPIFSFIGRNLGKILNQNWPQLTTLDYIWGDDDLMMTKSLLKSIDTRKKINPKAFFIDSWSSDITEELIQYDAHTDNIIAIYLIMDFYPELWIIVKDLSDIPEIDVVGVHFEICENINLKRYKKDSLSYGTHITSKNLESLIEQSKNYRAFERFKEIKVFLERGWYPFGFLPFIQFSLDAKSLYTTAKENTMKELDIEDGNAKMTLTTSSNPQDHISSFKLLHNDRNIVTCSCEEPLKLWEKDSGKLIRTFSHEDILFDLLVSHDDKYIIAAGEGGIIYVWDCSSGDLIREIYSNVRKINISPDSKSIICANKNNEIIIYGLIDGKEIKRFIGHSSEIDFISFTPDGENIISVSNDNTIKLWGIKKGIILKEFQIYDNKGEEDFINNAILSPDGKLICIPLDTHLKILDISTGTSQQLPFRDRYITGNAFFSLAFSYDGNYLAMSEGESIYLWRKIN